jgi:hypothetical protein
MTVRLAPTTLILTTASQELDGYEEYCATVKYRLIPFVW